MVDLLYLDLGAADIRIRFFRSGNEPLKIAFDDVLRLNSTVTVYHGVASSTNSSVGLVGTRAGQVSVAAAVNDAYGNPVVSGVQLRMTQGNQSTLHTPPHDGGGNYNQFLPIYSTGDYMLELVHNGALVKLREVVIRPGPPDAYFSTVEGSGLGNSQLTYGGCDYQAQSGRRLFAAGISYSLKVKVRDAWNNSADAAVASWDDQFAGHVSSAMQIRNGDVYVAFTPRKVGNDLPFTLLVDGLPVFATVARIVPGPLAEMSVSVTADQGRAGANITLQVHMADIEGNPLLCCCEAMPATLMFTHQSGQTSIVVPHTRLYYYDHEEVSAALPEVPGVYSLSMQAGDLRRYVSSFLVRAGAVDPASSYLCMSDSRSIGSIDFALVMVDRFNNSAPSLASITNITIIPPASVAVTVGPNDILITATNFTRAGEHLVYVSVDFEPISTYPFRFDSDALSNRPVAPKPRLVSYAALIAVGAACATCGVVFVAGLCGREKLRSICGFFAHARSFPLKRQLV